MESINLKTVDSEGVVENSVSGALHYGKFWPKNSSSSLTYKLPNNVNPADDFHTTLLSGKRV